MIEPGTIEELARRIGALLPPGLDDAKRDIEKNLRAVLQSWFDRLDLVTREEFEVQKAVLAKTRAKLEALEKELNALEGD
jgi:BMFP domain-containing protein YqiC